MKYKGERKIGSRQVRSVGEVGGKLEAAVVGSCKEETPEVVSGEVRWRKVLLMPLWHRASKRADAPGCI